MSDLLVNLYAVADGGAWDHSKVTAWADEVITSVDSPAYWLIEISLAKTSQRICAILAKELMKYGGFEKFEGLSELQVGLVLLQYDAQELDEDNARHLIVDIVDGDLHYFIDPEEVIDMELADEFFTDAREQARKALASLRFPGVLKKYRTILHW